MNISGTGATAAMLGTQGTQSAGASFRDLKSKVESAVADKLGIGVDQLQAELKSGKSLADVAKAGGMSRDDLLSTITSTLQAAGAGSAQGNVQGTGQGAAQGTDLTQLANRIADHVGGHHRHGHGGGVAQASSTQSAQTSSQLAGAALLQQGTDADGDHDGSPQATSSPALDVTL